MKRLYIIQFFGNALIILLFYWWLGIRDSRASQIFLSVTVGVLIVAGTIWLHSRTFNEKPLRFAALFAGFLLIAWVLSLLPIDKAALWVASTLTFRSRRPVNPDTVRSILNAIRWTIQWIVVPVALLHRYRSPMFWLQYVAIVFICFFLPGRLIGWVPKLESTTAQVISFLLRDGAAYCVAIAGFIAFARLTSSGKPVESQPAIVEAG